MSILRREADRITEVKKMFDGDGEAVFHKILNGPDEMQGKGRVFSVLHLNKGCEVGWHVHHGDCECYYILSGSGEYSDNGSHVTLKSGDVAFVGDGEGHSLKNNSEKPLEAIALILYT